jgi:hypothetical protein
MPNYFVPTNYFIDWSDWSVNRMKTLTVNMRDGNGGSKLCSRFQNANTYFQRGISFSRTGVYCPTFRINSASVYDTEGSMIFFNYQTDTFKESCLFSSKFTRYFLKNYVGHTVHTQIDELKDLTFTNQLSFSNKIILAIIQKQKIDPYYDYASHEQIEIDKLVYEAYGLNAEDIAEVENWYARRYPKLSQAQKANLRKLNHKV